MWYRLVMGKGSHELKRPAKGLSSGAGFASSGCGTGDGSGSDGGLTSSVDLSPAVGAAVQSLTHYRQLLTAALRTADIKLITGHSVA